MINKKYKCPSCGNDVKCDVRRILSPGRDFKDSLYHYMFICGLYACNMPFQVGILDGKPDDEKVADELYEYWVEEYKKYEKENKK